MAAHGKTSNTAFKEIKQRWFQVLIQIPTNNVILRPLLKL